MAIDASLSSPYCVGSHYPRHFRTRQQRMWQFWHYMDLFWPHPMFHESRKIVRNRASVTAGNILHLSPEAWSVWLQHKFASVLSVTRGSQTERGKRGTSKWTSLRPSTSSKATAWRCWGPDSPRLFRCKPGADSFIDIETRDAFELVTDDPERYQRSRRLKQFHSAVSLRSWLARAE